MSLYGKGRGGFETERRGAGAAMGGEDQMKMEAELGILQPRTKKHLETSEAGRGKEVFGGSREHGPADTLTLDFWPPEL